MCPSPPWSSGTPNSDTNLPQGMGHAMRSSPPWSPSAPNSDTPPCSLSDRRSAQNTHIATPTPPHVRCPICVRAARTHARRRMRCGWRCMMDPPIQSAMQLRTHVPYQPCNRCRCYLRPCNRIVDQIYRPCSLPPCNSNHVTSHVEGAMQLTMSMDIAITSRNFSFGGNFVTLFWG